MLVDEACMYNPSAVGSVVSIQLSNSNVEFHSVIAVSISALNNIVRKQEDSKGAMRHISKL
jgi:hypothetical protein